MTEKPTHETLADSTPTRPPTSLAITRVDLTFDNWMKIAAGFWLSTGLVAFMASLIFLLLRGLLFGWS